MKVLRLIVWFAVGLALGGWSVASFAVTFNSAAGPNGVMQRSSDGRLSGLNLPGSSINPPTGITASTSPGGLTLSESGRWELLDPAGRTVSVPGKQTLTLDANRLSKLAGSAASLLRGGIQGAIVNALLQEGIRLVNDAWLKDVKSTIDPTLTYYFGGFVGTLEEIANPVCVQTLGAGMWGVVENGGIKCTNGSYVQWVWPQVVRKCPDGRTVNEGASCGESVTTAPATETDLQNALYKRSQVADAALKDYYDVLLANSQRVKAQDLAMDPSTKYQASGTPTQGQPVNQTTTNPDGSTVTRTETPTYNVQSNGDTYNNNQVTINNTTVTNNNTTNNDGTTTTTTTTQTKPQEDVSFTDKDLPPVPDLYTPKYPDGLAGVWNDKISSIKSSSLFAFVSTLSSGAPDSGSCPSWTLSLVGIGQLGSYVLQPPCMVWPFVRWALLITALFVARRLVFGG